jgi:hypothetical protein
MAVVLRQFPRSISGELNHADGVPQHTSDYLRKNSGSLAIFAAFRRALSFVSSLAAKCHGVSDSVPGVGRKAVM